MAATVCTAVPASSRALAALWRQSCNLTRRTPALARRASQRPDSVSGTTGRPSSSVKTYLAACNSRAFGSDEPWLCLARRAGARLARAEGDFSRANALACDGLRLAYSGGGLLYAIDLLELVAISLVDVGRPADAVRLLGAAESQRHLVRLRSVGASP